MGRPMIRAQVVVLSGLPLENLMHAVVMDRKPTFTTCQIAYRIHRNKRP